MIIEVLEYLICFSIFVVLQALAINGIYEAFRGNRFEDGVTKKVQYTGMVFYMMAPAFFERNKNKNWSKPFYSCIKCMASVYGAITFWSVVLSIFGFHVIEILIFIFDVCILCYLNFYFYKRI